MGLKQRVRSGQQAPTRRRRAASASVGAPSALKARVAESAPAFTIVPPRDGEPKSGCWYCPLLPFSADWSAVEARYARKVPATIQKEMAEHKVHHRCVEEAEWSEVDVLFVGEAPGADEDKKGDPFVGRSGGLLRRTVEEFIPDLKVGYTNVVRCRPPMNRDPSNTIVHCCSGRLLAEIAARKPSLVVCLGNVSLGLLTGQSGITTLTGHFLDCVRPEFPGLKIMGCLHPAYVLRMDHELDRFIEAIELAQGFIRGEVEPLPGAGEYFTVDDLEDLRILVEEFIASDEFTFDTECGSLSPFDTEHPHLLCFSFSNEEGVGYTVPFDHEDSPWRVGGEREEERDEVIALLQRLLTCPTRKIAQNEKFDRKHIRKALGVEPVNVVDTMLTHLVVDERKGTHGLKALAFVYTGMGGYERPLDEYKKKHPEADPDKGGSYANIPGKILFPYAAMDSDVTLRVHHGLLAEPDFANNQKFQALALHFLPALSEVLADLEYNGAHVDSDVVAELDDEYLEKMSATQARINALPEVIDTVGYFQAKADAKRKPGSRAKRKEIEFNPRSPQQMRRLLFEQFGERPVTLTDTGFERLKLRWKRKKDKGEKASFQSCVEAAIAKREWDIFSTDAECLQEIARRGNTFAETLLEFREYATLYSTFIHPLVARLDENGLVHGLFNIFGTVTGRLSSEDPNLQNIPNKGGGKIKRAYTSRFGDDGLILQIDYSQIELRKAASWFNEPTMIRVYREGGDIHTETAIDISGFTADGYKKLPKTTEDGKGQKDWRTKAKRTNFLIIYGGGPPGLQSTLKKDGVFVTVEEAGKLIDAFYRKRPALKRGIERTEQMVLRDGYLESFTGRHRRVPEVRSEDEELVARALRQAVNFPIQSGAADMTLMSMVLIWREMKRRGLRSKMILTVHDSIVFDCVIDEVLEVAKLAKEIMESLPERSDAVLPGLDWKWLKCPIVAECEVGKSWGTLVEFDPFVVDAEGQSAEDLIWEEDGKEICRQPVNVDELCDLIEWKHAA